MKLSISYSELSDIIQTKTGKNVKIEYVDSKSINVRTTIKDSRIHNVLLKKIVDKFFDLVDIEVKVLLRVNSVSNDQLSMQYNTSKYADKLISFIGNMKPEMNEYMTFREENVAVVSLNRIELLQNVLSKIIINDICFSQDGAEVCFNLK